MNCPVRPLLALILSSLIPGLLHAQTPFRTDDGDAKLPWYQIQPGVFPPEGSAHYFSGELIRVDHLERQFVLRVDRTDAQNRSHWDLPVFITMLPYGSIHYHGAPAALEDIPLGTHLHGQFYAKDPLDKTKPLEGWHNRISFEGGFNRCLRLEDDFSYHQRQNQLWRIEEVNEAEKKLTATLLRESKPVDQPKTFDLIDSTRVWLGRSVASVKELTKGQTVQLNLTWATLYGPGRIREIWADDESRALATTHQLEKHHLHTRNRGLAGWIDAVDNQKRLVTITFFDIVDPKLFDPLQPNTSAAVAVAKHNLLTYDPVNDRQGGTIQKVTKVPLEPGNSGLQIQIQTNLLLEGFRPHRFVRLYPSGWSVLALPKEEELFGRED